MHAQSRSDWAQFDPALIPTKANLSHVEAFISALPRTGGSRARVLDIGCGAGGATRLLLSRGLSVVGIDINAAAIAQLRRELSADAAAEFHERDVASAAGFGLGAQRFDGAVCQLVASVVGDAQDRAQLLRNTHAALCPGGALSISFSGLSGDINAQYAELYACDMPLTGEHGSYLSRAADGSVLYRTHHFSADEIRDLLQEHAFCAIEIAEIIETSSRRPDQRARLYYASCRRE